MKPKKPKKPNPTNFKPIGFVFERAGLEIRIANMMALQDDQAVLLRDPYEQMMVYRAKPDEALRFATQLAHLIGRALDRTAADGAALRWPPPGQKAVPISLKEFMENAFPEDVRTGRVPTGRKSREK